MGPGAARAPSLQGNTSFPLLCLCSRVAQPPWEALGTFGSLLCPQEPESLCGAQDCVGDVETVASEPMAWLRGWTGQGRYGEWVLGPMWVVDAIQLHDCLRSVIGT